MAILLRWLISMNISRLSESNFNERFGDIRASSKQAKALELHSNFELELQSNAQPDKNLNQIGGEFHEGS